MSKTHVFRNWGLLTLLMLFPANFGTAQENATDPEMMKKASLIIGFNIASNIVAEGVEVDRAELMRGIEMGLDKKPLGIDEKDMKATMMAFQAFVEAQQTKKMKLEADANRVEGEKLMADTAARQGVQKLPSGVLYEVLTAGTGATPTAEDMVKIHYHGTLADGTVFDSSVQRNEPAEFPVNRVVKGFSAALQAMKVGDKWRVTIPSDLAYGIQGPPGIGPNRTLVFELELLEIVTK